MRIVSLMTTSGQSIDLGKFTVLVGANNVGKSQTLRDILTRVSEGPKGRTVILSGVELEFPPSVDQWLGGLSLDDDPRQTEHKICRGVSPDLVSGQEVRYAEKTVEEQFEKRGEENSAQWLLSQFGKFQVAFLDAGSRLRIAASGPSHDPSKQAPQTLLQELMFDSSGAVEKLQDAFRDTFSMEVRLDYSAMANLYLRVAHEFPTPLPKAPAELRPFMKRFQSLDEQGDGFRSFAGVVLSLLLSRGRILLIDEPEAFLHPAQARKLGYWVGKYASESAAQVLVSTHNSHFLGGVISSRTEADIYRLNRVENDTRYQLIEATTIESLSASPLLSSQRVMDAVFSRGVVVCEADSDRLFYQTASALAHDEREVQFLNAHSKQTLKDVVSLLRAASIPCAAIADIDLLNSSTDLSGILEALACIRFPASPWRLVTRYRWRSRGNQRRRCLRLSPKRWTNSGYSWGAANTTCREPEARCVGLRPQARGGQA